jgi:hypothetical protein
VYGKVLIKVNRKQMDHFLFLPFFFLPSSAFFASGYEVVAGIVSA